MDQNSGVHNNIFDCKVFKIRVISLLPRQAFSKLSPHSLTHIYNLMIIIILRNSFNKMTWVRAEHPSNCGSIPGRSKKHLVFGRKALSEYSPPFG
jgi:hypothetical protein